MKIKIGVSARHVHLTKEDIKLLFGEPFFLTKKFDLSQHGQYACNEQVTIKGPKGQIEKVRILGPERDNTQVEVSKTDSFKLGINPPVRNSGDLSSASEITIIGPKGQITKKAAIIAARHIHASYNDAKKYGFIDKKIVKIKVSRERSGTLENVCVRLDDSFSLEAHIDTDEANAFLIESGDYGELIIE